MARIDAIGGIPTGRFEAPGPRFLFIHHARREGSYARQSWSWSHLMINFQMTPEDYRAKWGLPRDYPMVAPAYAKQRRELAQKIGLGRKKVDVLAPAVKTAKKSGKTETAVATPSPRSAADRQKCSHPWQNRLKRDPGEPAHAPALISDWRGRHRVK